ncbi:protein kinase domain-containing protein, partial [Salmonella sp. s51228]|uniref:protein kinase domain-containing protein n=1 Tax=Salmonella sp. s51228 TaxID=3159652 RepID=UPI0039809F32
MAPEMLSSNYYNHSIDYWGLGVVLYAISTGDYPYSACETYCDMRQKIADGGELVYPEHINTDLISLINGLLTVNPAMRISSLKEILSHPFCKQTDEILESEHT